MSMNQIAEFLKPGPRIPKTNMQGDPIFCFVYDPIKWHSFRQQVPSALVLGFGRIDGFVFHVNELGEPNIRVAFMNGNISSIPPSHTVLPAPVSRMGTPSPHGPQTHGWVFRVPRTDDELLHTIFGKDNRLRIVRTATVVINHEKPKRLLIQVPVITYWDPRHTCSSHENLVPDHSEYFKEAKEAIELMRSVGMGKEAGTKIFNHLQGITEDIEPLLIRPSLLAGKERFVAPAPRRLRLSKYNGFKDVEINFKHPLNNTPLPQSARKVVEQSSNAEDQNKGTKAKAHTKKAKAEVHNKRTFSVKGVIVSPVGKAVMAPPPQVARLKTAPNTGKNLRILSLKENFEAAKAEREAETAGANREPATARPNIEPPAKRQRSNAQGIASGGRVVERAVVEKKKKEIERNPEWVSRMG